MRHPFQKGVIFDFDGTMVDTLSEVFDRFNAIAPSLDLNPIDREQLPLLRRMTSRQALKELGIPLHRVPALNIKLRDEMSNIFPTLPLVPELADCLRELHTQGVMLGVVTSNSRKNVLSCLKNNDVLDLFEFVHSTATLFGKHLVLRHLIRKRRLGQVQLFYVGDETRDIEAAHKSGLPVIAASWGLNDPELLRTNQPDCLATTPRDIYDYVVGWNTGEERPK